MKDPKLGYISEFMTVMAPLLEICQEKKIKVISNAGALNPKSLAKNFEELIKEKNLSLKVASIEGDDVLSKLGKDKKMLTANAYLGAGPIVKALEMDADIIITGRHVDSAGVIASMVYEFGWDERGLDQLATAGLVGHLIECGTQVTGGNFTDWQEVPSPENMGFPVAECHADGKVIITKPDETGGLVSIGSVAEQLVYEIRDPENYILPDVICDFSQVKMKEVSNNQVEVSGAKGKKGPRQFKVSSTSLDGFRCTATFFVDGLRANEKAKSIADNIIKKTENIFSANSLPSYKEVYFEALGSEERFNSKTDSNEIVGRLSVKHDSKEALEIFASEIAPSSTSLAPGITNLFGGRPRVQPVVSHDSQLINKTEVVAQVTVGKESISYNDDHGGGDVSPTSIKPHFKKEDGVLEASNMEVPLEKLAWARSGDKGAHANIGVIARKPEYLKFIKNSLTHDVIKDHFKNMFSNEGEVESYDLPGVHAINFVLLNSLDGGGLQSLRVGPQGKAYAQRLLSLPIKVPKGFL